MERNKNLGQTFTPACIVRFMLAEIGYKGVGKIIDNSCGNGAFLQEIAKIMMQNLPTSFENLYGWDIDAEVVTECLQNLQDIYPYTWQVCVVQDSIAEPLQIPANLFEEPIQKPAYLGSFDYVIGNPPYISYKECTQQNILSFQFMKEGKLKLSDIYGVNLHSVPQNPKKYAPNPNLYAFFMALGLGLLKEGGKMAYIIPQTLLVAGDLDVLRYHLAKYVTIEKICTFTNSMFIERGLKQNKKITTSSLIIFLKKELPAPNHKTIFRHFTELNNDLEVILKGKFVENKVLQTELLDNVLNWNYLQQEQIFLDFYTKYKQNEDISLYYQHSIATKYFGSMFYFDRGLKFPKDQITNLTTQEEQYFLPNLNKKYIAIKAKDEYILTKLLDFPFGSQGEEVYKATYKIVWSYMNFDKFYFSDENIMIDYNYVLISSNNKPEMLYLLGLLNSFVSIQIFQCLLKLPHEQDLLIGIKTIKDFIKIPAITPQNQTIKDKIIQYVEELLALEQVKLSDLVDFRHVMTAKFADLSMEVRGNELVLMRGGFLSTKTKIIGLPIKDKAHLVVNFAQQTFEKISLEALKNTIVLDEVRQNELKQAIDDLVFCLYFNVQLTDLQTNTFNLYLQNGKK